MKAVILSAGQGKRLLPLTADCPKCILKVRGRTFIEWQIDELAKCGIDQVTVVTLTEKGQEILSEIRRTQSDVFSTVATSLGLSPQQVENSQEILEHAIGFFNRELGLNFDK